LIAKTTHQSSIYLSNFLEGLDQKILWAFFYCHANYFLEDFQINDPSTSIRLCSIPNTLAWELLNINMNTKFLVITLSNPMCLTMLF
jgi:hypothetical protein